MIQLTKHEVDRLLEGEVIKKQDGSVCLRHLNRDVESYDYIEHMTIPIGLEMPLDIGDETTTVELPDDAVYTGSVRLHLQSEDPIDATDGDPVAEYAVFDADGNFLSSDSFYKWADGVELDLPPNRTEKVIVCADFFDPLDDNELRITDVDPVVSEV